MYKLLIVEDEKLLRQGLIHMLPWMEHGFIITGDASNGEEALRCIEASMPDIVITDIVMPVMNGLELTRIIKKKYPSIQIIILSSHNDFVYARETLRLGVTDYILKQEIDSSTVLKSLRLAVKSIKQNDKLFSKNPEQSNVSLQTQLFLNLLSTSSPEVSSIQELKRSAEITLEDTNIRIIIYTTKILKHEAANKLNLNVAFLKNILESNNEALRNPYTFVTSENAIVVLFNSTEKEINDVSELAQKSIKNIAATHNISLIALVSNLFSGLEHLRSNYEHTLKISEHLFFNPDEKIFLYDFYKTRMVKPNLDYKTIHPYLEKLEFNKVYDKVTENLTKLIAEGLYFEVYEVKKSIVELVNFTVFRLYEMGFELSDVKKARFEYIQSLESSVTIMELIQQFKTIITTIDQSVKDSRNGRTRDCIKRAKEYILKNYASDISLSTLADYLYMNKSYLSELFKEQVGENFSDYLIRIRMEKAKEILISDSIPISAVGERVGYPNTSYFTQLFKKIVGMKPLEYAKMFRKI